MTVKKLLFLFLIAPCLLFAHEGVDHAEKKDETSLVKNYFSSVAVSGKYELLLKYGHMEPGGKSKLKLFVSDFNTNSAIDSVSLKITSPELPSAQFEVQRLDKGVYEISAIFPEARAYSLALNINSSLGPDLMLLGNITAGKEPETHEHEEETSSFFSSKVFLFIAGTLAGVLVMLLLLKLKGRKNNPALFIMLLSMSSLPVYSPELSAHGGDDHDEEKKKNGGGISESFEVLKETQFLFNVLTHKVETGMFGSNIKLLGTVVPASDGRAILSSPQTGKVHSLHVKVGQKVKKGELLAVVEQNIDAATQLNMLTEKNNIDAEYEAARKNYERLKSIEDIAAKREVTEAKARFDRAAENKRVFGNMNSGSGQGPRHIQLRSPIDGVVDHFNLAIGYSVNSNETILSVTDPSKVYVEAVVFQKDAGKITSGNKFIVLKNSNGIVRKAELKFLSLSRSVDPSDQSRRALFELDNADGKFTIGEFVNVRLFSGEHNMEISVPGSAITEIDGKPAVFIKDDAEKISVSFVSTGEDDGSYIVIEKGVEENERVVVNSVYQVKMIYLNQ
jgi:cobalt-zinc-cadmium efflux system membrane fusion protein